MIVVAQSGFPLNGVDLSLFVPLPLPATESTPVMITYMYSGKYYNLNTLENLSSQ